VLGHGAIAGASVLGNSVKSIKFEVNFSSSTATSGFNTSRFELVSSADLVRGPGESVPETVQCEPGAQESSFSELTLDSPGPAERMDIEAQGSETEGNQARACAPRAPRAASLVLRDLDWCLSTQTMELLCLGVLESTKLQGRGHALLRNTLDVCLALHVPDSSLAAYQTRMLISIMRFLERETNRDLVLHNTKLAINMCKLCEYAVDKLYTGWILAGHDQVVSYCVHCIRMVADENVYSNLYRAAATSTWRAVLYLLRVAKGQALCEALDYACENSSVVLNQAGMDNVTCWQVFKALCDLLLKDDADHPDHAAVTAAAGRLTGQLLSVSSPHSRQAIMALLVYKPSITAQIFRKGEKEKAIDLMKNGFEKLCGSESVSSLNPLRTGWKAGDHLPDFQAWALEASTKQRIHARLAQGLEGSSKEWEQRLGRLVADDACPFRLRSSRDREAGKRKLASKGFRLAAMQKRSVRALLTRKTLLLCASQFTNVLCSCGWGFVVMVVTVGMPICCAHDACSSHS